MMKEILENIKVGDIVDRYLSTIPVPMQLKVTEITDKEIKCGEWTFSRSTGAEIDEYLGWDGVNITGSFILPTIKK